MSSLEANLIGREDQEEEEKQRIQEPSEREGGEQHTEYGGAREKRVRKELAALAREPGKSLLPFSRVQKIIKADKDIPIVAREATFLISLATEEFIKRLCEAGKRVAEREKRATVQQKDIVTVVRKVDEFLFLEEIIPWMSLDVPTRRRPQGAAGVKSPTILDQFIVSAEQAEGEDVFV